MSRIPFMIEVLEAVTQKAAYESTGTRIRAGEGWVLLVRHRSNRVSYELYMDIERGGSGTDARAALDELTGAIRGARALRTLHLFGSGDCLAPLPLGLSARAPRSDLPILSRAIQTEKVASPHAGRTRLRIDPASEAALEILRNEASAFAPDPIWLDPTGGATVLQATRVPDSGPPAIRVAGAGLLLASSRKDGAFGYLADIYVRSCERRAGVGARLIAALIEEARTRGLERLALIASPQTARTGFYARAGFVVAGWVRSFDLPSDR